MWINKEPSFNFGLVEETMDLHVLLAVILCIIKVYFDGLSKHNWMIPESKRQTTNILAVIREYLQYAFWVKRAIFSFEQKINT